MRGTAVHRDHIPPSVSIVSPVGTLVVDECDTDVSLVSIPRPEIQIVVRFGPSAQRGLDVHAVGVQQRVHRKLIRAGQRTVTARLRLGSTKAVLGVPASAITGRIVALEDLWGDAMARRFVERLAAARSTVGAAAIVERALAERLAVMDAPRASPQLALEAAERLASATVSAVAADLGVSERHLRRVFREAIGVSPKAFAKLMRFHRAIRAAREDGRARWGSIAVETGYYDQAHLIDEFRAIAGVTPRVLLDELGEAASSAAR
jgi:AraC-like DNA-binding protein